VGYLNLFRQLLFARYLPPLRPFGALGGYIIVKLDAEIR
jgi:hypothetical protein